MLSSYFAGISSYGDAWDFVRKHGLWSYMTIPGLISLLVGIGLGMGGWYAAGSLSESITLPDWLSFLDGILVGAIFLVEIIVLLILFKYIVMIVSAPFMGPLSEKVESIITGSPGPKFNMKEVMEDLGRAVRLAVRNLFFELLWTLLFLLLQVIPLVGQILSTVGIFLIQAFYAGFGNFDPVLERQRFKVRDRVRFVRDHRWLTMGNGTIFVLLSLVPIIGWSLGPALGTVAATMDGLEELERV
jgi:CysZ protein